MGAVVSPLNQIPPSTDDKNGRLEGAALLGLVVLLVVTPLPGFLSKLWVFSSVLEGRVSVEEYRKAWWVWFQFFSAKKNSQQKHPESLTTKSFIIGNPYKWGCFFFNPTDLG